MSRETTSSCCTTHPGRTATRFPYGTSINSPATGRPCSSAWTTWKPAGCWGTSPPAWAWPSSMSTNLTRTDCSTGCPVTVLWATSPASGPAGLHLYYDARAGWGNKNGRQLRRYGMKVDVRCMGMVAIWDLSAVAEIVAQRAMALKPGRSLPKTVLGLTERPKPPEWGGRPPPERETPPPPRRPVMGASGAYQWQCPAPPDELLQTAAGGRNTALFDALRKSAYRLPRGSGNDDVRRRWGALWVDFAIQANRMFPEPLGEREVSKTAASVSRWTWTNPEFGRGGDDGRRDPAEQSKRGVVSGVVRRLRVRPRNARTVELHRREGLGLRAIARIVEVSASTVWRTLEADKLNPGCFMNQSPPRGENGVDGEEIAVNDEKRNNFAADPTNENRQKQPLQQSETANFTEKSYYIQASLGPPSTSSVDNSGGGVDNLLSAWEEAIREGARRRADESRRRAERGPRSIQERGPPEE